MEDVKLVFTKEEKINCLKEIDKRLQKILYVYEKSLEDDNYDFRAYVYSVIIFLTSSDKLFDYGLVDIIVNINSILYTDMNKKQIRKIVLDSKHTIQQMKKEME